MENTRRIEASYELGPPDGNTFGNNGPLRVLFVTPRYLPYMGGVENHVFQVARRLVSSGVDTTVLTTDTTGQLPSEENSDGIWVRRVRAWPAGRDYYFAPDIYRIITREPWDIIHVQSYHTLVAPVAMIAALQAKIPYIVTFHGGGHSSPLRNALRGVQQWLLRPLFGRAARLVAIAQFEIAAFSQRLRLSPEQFAFIPNGGDLPQIPEDETSFVDEGLIVSIGRLERYKGHHRVIAALPEILARRPDVHLWIAGDGPYKQDLVDLARKLGVAHRVDIRAIPARERERMARELSRAALVVILSEYETHPIAALEALALGRPLLVADTSGLHELAEGGLAQAISLKSTPVQIAAAVIENLDRPANGSCIAISTWEDCSTGLLSLYRDITGRNFCAS